MAPAMKLIVCVFFFSCSELGDSLGDVGWLRGVPK